MLLCLCGFSIVLSLQRNVWKNPPVYLKPTEKVGTGSMWYLKRRKADCSEELVARRWTSMTKLN